MTTYQEYVIIELPGAAPDGHCERPNHNLHQQEVQHQAGPQVPEQIGEEQYNMMMVRMEVMMYLLWMGLPICLAMSSSTSWRSTVT